MLFQTPDGGEVQVTNGVVALDDSPFTAVYISLFGGNIDDSGDTSTDSEQWWGNYSESDPVLHLRSRTQAILIGLPAIPANLVRVEEAVSSDLEWMKADIAESIDVAASLPARNTVRIQILITGRDGVEQNFDFTRPWGIAA